MRQARAQCKVSKSGSVGKCALIGGGSVVTKDVPDYAIILGNPARIVDYAADSNSRIDSGNTFIEVPKTIITGNTFLN